MSGFSNSVIGGGGVLVRDNIHSDGYVPGVTGWQVDKDGDAEFNDLTVRGSFMGLDYEVNSSGIFFYNGTPITGNLVISATNNSGTDAYGNNYGQGLNIGDQQASHFGVDLSGNIYLADSTGATRLYLSPGNSEFAIYSAATAAILMSMAPTQITDPLTGETAYEGFNVYGQGAQAGRRAQMGLNAGGNPLFMAVTGAADEANPAQWGTAIFNAGLANQFLFTQLVGPANSNHGDVAGINMQSSPDDGSGNAGGTLLYKAAGGLQTASLEWGISGTIINLASGMSMAIVDASGQSMTAGQSGQTLEAGQTVVSTSAGYMLNINSNPANWSVVPGMYKVSMCAHCTMGSVAAAINFGLNGPAASYVSVRFEVLWPTIVISQPPVSSTITSITGASNSASMTANDGFDLIAEGVVTFTASGTFGIVVGQHTSGDQWTINSGHVLLERIG